MFARTLFIIGTVVFVGLSSLSRVSADEGKGQKIAVIDTQRVINDSIAGKAARSNLEEQIQKAKLKISTLKSEFEKQKAELEKQSSILSGSALEERRESLAKKQRDFERAYQDLQEQLARANDKEIGRVVQEIQAVVKSVAQERGYSFVFEKDKQSIVFASSQIDITQDIIKLLDKKKVDL